MVLVLTELVQNAIEHAFPEDTAGTVEIRAHRERGELSVLIVDDGVGLPADFSLERSDRLGLQIVRTLVSSELGGQVRYRPVGDENPGTVAEMTMPLARGTR
jgi:two-component sensor histidine kinase